MATFQFLPGVRIQEVQLGAPPISGVGTSTAAFVGKVPKDNRPAGSPTTQLISSADDFAAKFIVAGTTAAATTSTNLSRAVAGFFLNGGTAVYVSIVDDDQDDTKVTN